MVIPSSVENEGFDVFSPSSANAAAGIFSAANATTPDQPLQPHEQRRLEKLAAEKQRFQEMDVSQYSAPLGDPCTIDRLHKPTKDQFMKNYAELGKPVIITGVMDDWEAMKYWNFEEIGKRYGWPRQVMAVIANAFVAFRQTSRNLTIITS